MIIYLFPIWFLSNYNEGWCSVLQNFEPICVPSIPVFSSKSLFFYYSLFYVIWHKASYILIENFWVVEHAVQTWFYILATFISFTQNGGCVELFTTHKSLCMRLLTTPLLISVRLTIDLWQWTIIQCLKIDLMSNELWILVLYRAQLKASNC